MFSEDKNSYNSHSHLTGRFVIEKHHSSESNKPAAWKQQSSVIKLSNIVNDYADMVSAQSTTTLTRCPRSQQLRGHTKFFGETFFACSYGAQVSK